jgi:hypothetical protein
VSNSAILGIPEIAENQNNKYITHNNAIGFFEQATQRQLANTAVGGSNWTLTESEFTRNFLFKASGITGATRDLITPSTVNSNATKRVFAAWNADDDQSLRVKAAGSGTTVTLAPGGRAVLQQVGDDITVIASYVASFAYDIGFFIPDQPDDNDLVAQFVSVRDFTLADDFAGSRGTCAVPPASTAAFTVKKNGSTIGTVSIDTSGVFTFATTGAGVTMAPGDILTVFAPTPQDANLADISMFFQGTRV